MAGRPVSEKEILDAALALLDAGGVEAASIRRIAAAVGVAPGTVYTYFPDGEAVAKALVERLLGAVDHAAGHRGDWRTRVEALALDLHRRMVAHPGAVPLLIGGRLDGPNARRLGEHLLALLAGGGLGPADAARGAYLVMVYVLGAIALEVADAPHLGALRPEAVRIEERRTALGGVPARAFPRTSAAAGVIAAWVGTEQFVWGLRRVLDALQRNLG
jgi:AcrR family transcriptional regulator